MVIGNFDRKSIAVFPAEAYAPLIVDADAPLAGAVAGKLLKPVVGRNTEKVEGGGAMKLLQFTLRNALHILRQFCRKTA